MSNMLIVGTRFSTSNQKPQGLSQASVELLQSLRALDIFRDETGLTKAGDAWLDEQTGDQEWASIEEIHAHFGLELNG